MTPTLPHSPSCGRCSSRSPIACWDKRATPTTWYRRRGSATRLTRTTRAVLVLREALDLSHAEIAGAIGTSEGASRQLLARARRRIASSHARATPSAEVHRRLADALVAAFRTGDVSSLVAVLREDVVAV